MKRPATLSWGPRSLLDREGGKNAPQIRHGNDYPRSRIAFSSLPHRNRLVRPPRPDAGRARHLFGSAGLPNLLTPTPARSGSRTTFTERKERAWNKGCTRSEWSQTVGSNWVQLSGDHERNSREEISTANTTGTSPMKRWGSPFGHKRWVSPFAVCCVRGPQSDPRRDGR